MSPTIPTYERKVLPKAIEYPDIPTGLASSGPEEALATAGQQIANEGNKWSEAIQKAQDVRTVGDLNSKALVSLNDLHNRIITSPDFIINPEAARQTWRTEADSIKTELSQGLDQNSHAARLFDSEWTRTQAAHEIQFANEIRKKTVDQVVGGNLQALQTYSNAIGTAPNSDVVYQGLKGIDMQIAGGIASGAFTFENGQKLKEHYRNQSLSAYGHNLAVGNPTEVIRQIETSPAAGEKDTHPLSQLDATQKAALRTAAHARIEHLSSERRQEQERQEREFQKNTVNEAYKGTLDLFSGDFAKATEYARNPANYPLLDEEKRRGLVSALESGAQWDRQQKDDLRKKNNDKVFDEFLKNPSAMTEATINATSADPQTRQHLIDLQRKNTEQRFKTDPAVEADVLGRIWRGDIKNRSDLLPFVGNGLGVDKMKELSGSIEQAQDPTKSKYFEMADKLFEGKYKDDKEMLKLKTEYLVVLDQHIKRDGLKGMDIFKKAEELLKPLEERTFWQWWNGSNPSTPFNKIVDKNPPWLTVESPPAAPTGDPVKRPLPLPPDVSGKYEVILKQNNMPVTPGNIKALYDQDQARGR